MTATGDSEISMLGETALDFAVRELEEATEERDRYPFAPVSEDVLSKALEVGFFSLMIPEVIGGAGQGMTALCTVLDNVCRKDASLGGVIFTNALAQEILMGAGTGELLGGLLGSKSSGELMIAFPSFNNPGEVRQRVEAERENEGYLLSGTVEYVVLGNIARRALLPARAPGREGYSFFLVDLSEDGVRVGAPVLSLGLRACPAVDVSLDKVGGTLVGAEGAGGEYFARAADRMSVAAAAMALGVMKGSFDTALAYTKQRRQGGREIVGWSEVRMILANMAVKLKACDLIVSRVCSDIEEGSDGWEMGSRAAAVHVSESACELTEWGIQLLGGNGYMREYGQEKRFRDAKQIQSLLGMAPMRKMEYIRRIVEGERPY